MRHLGKYSRTCNNAYRRFHPRTPKCVNSGSMLPGVQCIYALCSLACKVHWKITVPAPIQCVFNDMHYRYIHYYNFYCILKGKIVLECVLPRVPNIFFSASTNASFVKQYWSFILCLRYHLHLRWRTRERLNSSTISLLSLAYQLVRLWAMSWPFMMQMPWVSPPLQQIWFLHQLFNPLCLYFHPLQRARYNP